MIIMGFTGRTSKILPRFFCGRFRHCAPIVVCDNGQMILYQFVRRGNVQKINLRRRDIRILSAHGWVFVYLQLPPPHDFNGCGAWTCVQLSKHAIGMQNRYIQTPDALYKKCADCAFFSDKL